MAHSSCSTTTTLVASSSYEIRPATLEDVSPLLPFCRMTFTDTFGHLYPPSDLENYLSETYTTENYEAYVRGDNRTKMWVAYYSKKSGEVHEPLSDLLVGYCIVGSCDLPHEDVKSNDWELRRLYVSKEHQGTGVSHALMKAGIEYVDLQIRNCTRNGSESISSSGCFTNDTGSSVANKAQFWLGVWSENFRAQKFYSRYGFEKVGEYEYIVGNCRDREFIMKRREENI